MIKTQDNVRKEWCANMIDVCMKDGCALSYTQCSFIHQNPTMQNLMHASLAGLSLKAPEDPRTIAKVSDTLGQMRKSFPLFFSSRWMEVMMTKFVWSLKQVEKISHCPSHMANASRYSECVWIQTSNLYFSPNLYMYSKVLDSFG